MKIKHLHQLLDKEIELPKAQEFYARLSLDEQREVNAFQNIAKLAQEIPSPSPSDEFLARTMARIRTRPRPRRTLWTWLRTPWLSPLSLMASAAMVAVIIGGWPLLQTNRPISSELLSSNRKISRSPPHRSVMVRMVYAAPQAQAVAVAGDFNDWKPDITPLHRTPNGIWMVEIPLSVGSKYQYMFVVDDQWVTDPNAATTMDDGFGGKNALIEL
jgi:hypothetical protein